MSIRQTLKKIREQQEENDLARMIETRFIDELKRLELFQETQLLELEEKAGVFKRFIEEFAAQRNEYTNELRVIDSLIEDIETEYHDKRWLDAYLNVDGSRLPEPFTHWPPNYLAFHCCEEGYNPTLKEIQHVFSYYSITVGCVRQPGYKQVLEELAKGIADAKRLKWLKNLRDNLNTTKQITDNLSKLKWTGSTASFGYIMRELIDRKLLNVGFATTNLEAIAETLLSHFDIKGKQSSLVKELSNTSNSLRGKNSAEHRRMLKPLENEDDSGAPEDES